MLAVEVILVGFNTLEAPRPSAPRVKTSSWWKMFHPVASKLPTKTCAESFFECNFEFAASSGTQPLFQTHRANTAIDTTALTYTFFLEGEMRYHSRNIVFYFLLLVVRSDDRRVKGAWNIPGTRYSRSPLRHPATSLAYCSKEYLLHAGSEAGGARAGAAPGKGRRSSTVSTTAAGRAQGSSPGKQRSSSGMLTRT